MIEVIITLMIIFPVVLAIDYKTRLNIAIYKCNYWRNQALQMNYQLKDDRYNKIGR